jgi:hypothetical protein
LEVSWSHPLPEIIPGSAHVKKNILQKTLRKPEYENQQKTRFLTQNLLNVGQQWVKKLQMELFDPLKFQMELFDPLLTNIWQQSEKNRLKSFTLFGRFSQVLLYCFLSKQNNR